MQCWAVFLCVTLFATVWLSQAMKIALILNPIAEASPAGLGRAVLEHARHLMQLLPEHEYVLITKDTQNLQTIFPVDRYSYEVFHVHGSALWSTTKLWRRSDIDLFFFLTPPIPLLLPRKKVITLVHDFAFMYYEPLVSRIGMWILHTFACWRSGVVCAVSTYTKDEIQKWCRLPSSRIRVVYNGCDHLEVYERSSCTSVNPFLLHVGVMKERKNTLRIVMAFEQFLVHHPEFKLVLIGDYESAYGRAVRAYIKTHHLEGAIDVRGFVFDTTLSELYKKARGFVFPSLIEGFGFPILEAMAAGVPVLTSKRGALAEIAGDAAVLVDPVQVEDIARGMECLIDPLLSRESIKKGYERVHYFTWRRSAEAVRDAITASCV